MKPVKDCNNKGLGIETILQFILDTVPAVSPTGTHEQVDGTAGSASSVNTYTAGSIVRLVAINGSAGMAFGAVAAQTGVYLAPDVPEYFHVRADTLISVNGAIVDITVML
jgi:hypothetical protein